MAVRLNGAAAIVPLELECERGYRAGPPGLPAGLSEWLVAGQ